jgi:predicted transport protein
VICEPMSQRMSGSMNYRDQFRPGRVVSMKTHPNLDEKWLQALIVEDPRLLGLGDLVVKDVERRQPRAGRLDLLLADSENTRRYEVELQLGATDETHIIRTIEYWDIEKSRYPQYEHIAVIVAEDITSRFLNVISLFNKQIPIIAIQLNALEVEGFLTLQATRVLDISLLQEEEGEVFVAVDRAYWQKRVGAESLALFDTAFAMISELGGEVRPRYNRGYIGMEVGGAVVNFLVIKPRRNRLSFELKLPQSEEVDTLLQSSPFDVADYYTRNGQYRFSVNGPDLAVHADLLRELFRRAYRLAS